MLRSVFVVMPGNVHVCQFLLTKKKDLDTHGLDTHLERAFKEEYDNVTSLEMCAWLWTVGLP